MKSIAAILCLLLALLVGCASQPASRTRSAVNRAAAPLQTVTLAWDVLPGASVTGLDQTDALPPQWRTVAQYPVAANGGSFTASCMVINGQVYWRAWTR